MIKGVIAGNFDVIHPGYINIFKECKENCDHFTILLHSDPTIERPNKLKPVLTVEERIEVLSSIKYIDEIINFVNQDDKDDDDHESEIAVPQPSTLNTQPSTLNPQPSTLTP